MGMQVAPSQSLLSPTFWHVSLFQSIFIIQQDRTEEWCLELFSFPSPISSKFSADTIPLPHPLKSWLLPHLQGDLCILMPVLWHFQCCIILYWLVCVSHLQWPLYTTVRTLPCISLLLHCCAVPSTWWTAPYVILFSVKLDDEVEGRGVVILKWEKNKTNQIESLIQEATPLYCKGLPWARGWELGPENHPALSLTAYCLRVWGLEPSHLVFTARPAACCVTMH